MPSTRTASRLLRSRLLEALTFPHGTERYVELIDPLASRRDVRAEVVAVQRQTPKSVTLTLAPNENWAGARAGQFVGLTVEIDGRRQTRPYSPCGSEHAAGGTLQFTISTHPEGLVSRFVRDHARPGMLIHLEQAAGDFVLPSPRPERVLLISGGSGITPVLSMLRTLCDEGFAGDIGFLNYARSPELALHDADLRALEREHPNVRVAGGYTQSPGAIAGRFRPEHVGAVMDDVTGAATFVCGPPALIDAVRTTWSERGLQPPTVETFTPPAVHIDPDSAEGTVRFTSSATETVNSGLPLLEQAEDAGLSPDHGCRMGICNACSCLKRSGAVRNVLTGRRSAGADELIRICISVPVGDVEIDL